MGVAALWPGRIWRDSRTRAVTVALLIHVVLIGPIILGLHDIGGYETGPDVSVIPLDLRPPAWPDAGTVPARPSPAGAGPRKMATAPVDHTAPPPPVPIAVSPVRDADTPTGPIIDDVWRVRGARRGREAGDGDPCRDLSNFKAWEAAGCREHGPRLQAAARGSPPAEIARPDAPRGRRRGETGQEAFAEQAAANEAWRNYTRERDAPYPGLRSLMNHH